MGTVRKVPAEVVNPGQEVQLKKGEQLPLSVAFFLLSSVLIRSSRQSSAKQQGAIASSVTIIAMVSAKNFMLQIYAQEENYLQINLSRQLPLQKQRIGLAALKYRL